mmetsp:Transcript_46201/g.128838  ORF Transcript_46201/g.128838 Transcript_46201/m.128838 type:complete len:266 (+) Transcript_46201:2008-2805(+)
MSEATLETVKYLTCSASIVASLNIILHSGGAKWKMPGRRLLCWLSIADFATALSGLIPISSPALCQLQSVVGIFFPVAAFCWTDCIAFYVYKIIHDPLRRGRMIRDPHRMFQTFHLICWSVPCVVCCVVLFSGHAGGDPRWQRVVCWLDTTEYDDKDTRPMLAWQMIGGKAIETVSFVLTIVLYFLSIRRLSKQENFWRQSRAPEAEEGASGREEYGVAGIGDDVHTVQAQAYCGAIFLHFAQVFQLCTLLADTNQPSRRGRSSA